MKKNILKSIVLVSIWCGFGAVQAQELHDPYQGTYKGEVVEVVGTETKQIFGTEEEVQQLRLRLLEGPQSDRIVELDNDYRPFRRGDRVFVNHSIHIGGNEIFAIINIDRTRSLITLIGIFCLAVIAFGRMQGVRSLVALVVSFLSIMYILLPLILKGWDPLLVSGLVAGTILFAAIFFTHGFNRESVVAYSGTMIAVLLAGIFAAAAVWFTKLSGFAAEESVYLNFNTGGTIDFVALLLGAFIIGFLGVLDDIAVTQSAVVAELFDSNKGMSRAEVYGRAMRVGREHVGALVNTLVLAYTGAALPLLLYVQLLPTDFWTAVNSEVIATEIVRIVVGSLGLILTVPIVTLLAVRFLKGHKRKGGHHHGHHHH